MTIDALDSRLSKALTEYVERIHTKHSGDAEATVTYEEVIEIAKETSDVLTVFKQEVLRYLKEKEAEK